MIWDLYLESALLLIAVAGILWICSVCLKDVSIIDRFWGLLFILGVGYLFVKLDAPSDRQQLIYTLVVIWGLRLSLFLTYRNWNNGEDHRYRAMRQEQHQFWWKSLFRVFILQVLLAWIISSTLWGAMMPIAELSHLDVIATLVWTLGFTFEAIGDWQLMRFKSNPANAGKLLTTGLWSLTRHPNYFGDAMCWWAYALFAIANGQGWGIIGSALMTFLLLRISGVKMLEKTMVKTKPGYQDYMKSTPAFFPSLSKLKNKIFKPQ